MARLADGGTETSLIALGELDADALLGRRQDAAVQHALGLVERANILVASTPVYRATYTGLLKVFFDLFPQRALEGRVAFGIATGASAAHRVAEDQGLRPLFASVNAEVVPGVYATDAELASPDLHAKVLERVDRAVADALELALKVRRAGSGI
jgi:FMN reductase